MRVLTASGHSKVEVGCHRRRVSENWHPHTPPEPVEIGTVLVESNLASHLDSHQTAHTRWLTLTSGSLSHDNNQKEGRIIHEGIMGVLFSNGEKLELCRPEVGDLFL